MAVIWIRIPTLHGWLDGLNWKRGEHVRWNFWWYDHQDIIKLFSCNVGCNNDRGVFDSCQIVNQRHLNFDSYMDRVLTITTFLTDVKL